ncbi:hypothetical protein IG631_21920 [Alternaria alternata]|nr:hypothetical protein IG631_21920 [Alternaria alternata]
MSPTDHTGLSSVEEKSSRKTGSDHSSSFDGLASREENCRVVVVVFKHARCRLGAIRGATEAASGSAIGFRFDIAWCPALSIHLCHLLCYDSQAHGTTALRKCCEKTTAVAKDRDEAQGAPSLA